MISNETLTLYFYRDGLSADEIHAVADALRAEPELAARYARLCGELEQLREAPPVDVPKHLLQRWHDSIDNTTTTRAQNPDRPPRSLHLWSFILGGALTAAIALAIGVRLGDFSATDAGRLPPSFTAVNERPPTPASFARGLRVHLQTSRAGLNDISQGAEADRTLLIREIIEQNRMFERSADANNAPEVARLLRALEPVLLQLASDSTTPEASATLQARLGFELNVMLTKLSRRPSDNKTAI